MKKIILASGSPRRKDLLNQIGLEHTIMIPDVDEMNYDNLSPIEYVMDLARKKAFSIKNKVSEQCIIISADTVVVHNNKILGKPVSADDAFLMLNELKNDMHYVCTGLSILNVGDNYIDGVDKNCIDPLKFPNSFDEKTLHEKTYVTMRNYKESEIISYIESEEPFGKAGAYAIQGRGATLVKEINGDFYTVVGLPIAKVWEIVQEINGK